MFKKLNLGAGNKILSGYINHDIVAISGINIVHDLNSYPWPWDDNSFDTILMEDVLEHLDNVVPAIEELHRILCIGGEVIIRVPYWNHACAYIDPTHKRGFHEQTFHFFDVNSPYFQERSYYSNASFKIIEEILILAPGFPYFTIPKIGLISIRKSWLRKIIGWFGNHVSNVIADVQVRMKKV